MVRFITTIVLAAGLGVAVYCCGPKTRPPVPAPPCDARDEICQHDAIGDYDCICPE
jgi:hypothetical protein